MWFVFFTIEGVKIAGCFATEIHEFSFLSLYYQSPILPITNPLRQVGFRSFHIFIVHSCFYWTGWIMSSTIEIVVKFSSLVLFNFIYCSFNTITISFLEWLIHRIQAFFFYLLPYTSQFSPGFSPYNQPMRKEWETTCRYGRIWELLCASSKKWHSLLLPIFYWS